MAGILLHHDPYRNPFFLDLIEGAADSVASLLKLWSGGRSDQAGRRKGFVLFGYSFTVLTRPLIWVILERTSRPQDLSHRS